MKKFLFCIALIAFAGCSSYDDTGLRGKIDSIGEQLESLEQEIASLRKLADDINGDIEALQAIANGISITSVTETAGGFVITFSNGKSFTITNGETTTENIVPKFRIDEEGYWQVSLDGVNWEYPQGQKVPALGSSVTYTPVLGVDSEGYWTITYDNETYIRIKDAEGNDVPAGGTSASGSVFESAKLSADGTCLELVLAGSNQAISVPVCGKSLASLLIGGVPVEGVQEFKEGETKEYSVDAPANSVIRIIDYPDGWKVVYASGIISVTAPSSTITTTATADSSTDISILAVTEAGLSCIVVMQVSVTGGSQPGPGPVDPGQPVLSTYILDAAEVKAAALDLPSGKSDLQALSGSNTWIWNEIGIESRIAVSTSSNASAVKVPILYFYKLATAVTETFITNTTPLGEITKVTVNLIDNGAKKGNLFVMTQTVGQTSSTVLSNNDNTTSTEHVYTFSAGNNGIFHFSNPSENDCKVISIEVEYKK